MADEPRYEEIRPRTRVLGRVLVHHRTTGSTMDDARRLAQAGEPDGLVVVADEQTAGVGRRGRRWHSPAGSLHATILLRPVNTPKETLTWIPLLAGVAMVQAVGRVAGVDARLKWPNDVLVDGKKLAGVLTDARWQDDGRLAWVLIGVGVNGDARADDFPPELRPTATSLSQAAGRHVCMPALLKVFLERLEPLLEAASLPFDDLRAKVEPSLATLGRRVRVTMPRGVVEGVARGLGPRGELLLETPEGEVRVEAGDCEHLRPA
jgi:BirA family biotin operon repressor/biotin-[acetyl-CoA-carboxylase] ligase